MYESPISLVMLDQIQQEVKEATDQYVLHSVQNIGVKVDKEDLAKALSYDRKQYEKGYADALLERKTGKWETVEGWGGDVLYQCSECGTEFVLIDGTPQENDYRFCPHCGADMRGEEDE